jgi:hypothetical protein
MARFAFLLAAGLGLATAGERHYRLKDVDLKQRVIWGAECEGPNGAALAFGGQDQEADDGHPHTRIRVDGQWKAIHEELRAKNPLQKLRDQTWAGRNSVKAVAARARRLFLEGKPDSDLSNDVPELDMAAAVSELGPELTTAYEAVQLAAAAGLIRSAAEKLKSPARKVTPELIQAVWAAQVSLEKAADALDAEPSPRALSPIAYDAKTGLFILFGGDHLDYLTNDPWIFDPST